MREAKQNVGSSARAVPLPCAGHMCMCVCEYVCMCVSLNLDAEGTQPLRVLCGVRSLASGAYTEVWLAGYEYAFWAWGSKTTLEGVRTIYDPMRI